MLEFTLKVGREKKRLRIIRDENRIDEELQKYNYKKYEKNLLQQRETEEEKILRIEREDYEEQKRIEDFERSERLKDLERKEAIITKYWNEFVISNEGKLLELDLSKVSEDSVPISVAKEEIQHAYERGMEDGQMQAFATYKTEIEKYQEWIRRIDSVTDELKREHLFAIKNFEENMIELSCSIAETILDDEITKDNSIVIKQVRGAIASVHNEKIFKIHVNPELVKILEEVKSTLLLDHQEANKIEIYPNPSVPIGGCLLETSGGLLDARIKNQLRKIYKELEIENDRVFNTKEVEQELNQYLSDLEDDNIAQTKTNDDNLEDIDLADDFNYDDMPEEYKEMFGEDIFSDDEINLSDKEKELEQENQPELPSNEIDYQSLYEDELKEQEEKELSKFMEEENKSEEETNNNNKFDEDTNNEDNLNDKSNNELNNEFNDEYSELNNSDIDIPLESDEDKDEPNQYTNDDNTNDNEGFGLDNYNFEDDI